tara:strand:+ start:8343 stop:9131 length:789 start_codon:yes stop_codon:yes gene_type:complete
MLISHEVPKCLFQKSLDFNDYDYALVHLFDKDEEYLKFYMDSVKLGRHVLLDNSIFELGEAYDNDSFAKWVEILKPTEYIVPDALEDVEKTVKQMEDWNRNYKNIPGKKIGVVQGKTPDEIADCYVYMDKHAEVDKIAISFDYSVYEEIVPHENKYISWMLGRAAMLANLLKAGVINTNKPHHLLGCGLPQEFALYHSYKWIESVDTSNPIVHGIKGIAYKHYGLQTKESIKLVDLLDVEITNEQLYDINHNIQYFRTYANG